MSLTVIYTTHPDKECAERITKLLIEKRLVACGNIYPINSYYWWNDNIESSNEWVVIYKTTSELMQEIKTIFASEHPYEVPCIVHWDAEANEPYKAWVLNEVSDRDH